MSVEAKYLIGRPESVAVSGIISVASAGKFTATKIAAFIQESGIADDMDNKELIIPGYVAILSGALEDKLEGWKITVGPREANALPAFLKSR